MKKLVLAIIFTLAAASGVYAADVGVSVSVGQPGFYGRLDIGDFPRPQVVYAKPVVVRPVRVGEPVYLHVPPGQAKNWSRNCGKYNACDRPVYFVKERWYNKVYVPQYQARHGNYGHGNQGGPQGRH